MNYYGLKKKRREGLVRWGEIKAFGDLAMAIALFFGDTLIL